MFNSRLSSLIIVVKVHIFDNHPCFCRPDVTLMRCALPYGLRVITTFQSVGGNGPIIISAGRAIIVRSLARFLSTSERRGYNARTVFKTVLVPLKRFWFLRHVMKCTTVTRPRISPAVAID